jgi:hypothetical protein
MGKWTGPTEAILAIAAVCAVTGVYGMRTTCDMCM